MFGRRRKVPNFFLASNKELLLLVVFSEPVFEDDLCSDVVDGGCVFVGGVFCVNFFRSFFRGKSFVHAIERFVVSTVKSVTEFNGAFQ